MNGTIGLVRIMNGEPDVDLEQRVLRRVVIATTGVASDGWIVLPSGMSLERFKGNPVVTARHLVHEEGEIVSDFPVSPVIGRAIALTPGSQEIGCEIQFADTGLGRDYAYLYGVNERKEVYMRAWSIEGPVLEQSSVSWADAQKLAGSYWDQNGADRIRSKGVKKINVALRFELNAFAACAVGADRSALTRAWNGGIETAGSMIARMDLNAAMTELAAHKKTLGEVTAVVTRLEGQIQALRGEGASAAARGDSEALLDEVRDLVRIASRK